MPKQISRIKSTANNQNRILVFALNLRVKRFLSVETKTATMYVKAPTKNRLENFYALILAPQGASENRNFRNLHPMKNVSTG